MRGCHILFMNQERGGLTLFNLFCLCLRGNVAVLYALVTDDDSNVYFSFDPLS